MNVTKVIQPGTTFVSESPQRIKTHGILAAAITPNADKYELLIVMRQNQMQAI